MLFDNTTVTGSWIQTNTSDLTAAYDKYSRIVNNITMSMPHAGIFSAAHDAKNGILQPEDLAGVGEYSIRASVVSPAINVLCVNMNSTELAPLVYTEWPNAITTNSDIPNQKIPWSGYEDEIQLQPGQTYLIRQWSTIFLNGVQLTGGSLQFFQWYVHIFVIPGVFN